MTGARMPVNRTAAAVGDRQPAGFVFYPGIIGHKGGQKLNLSEMRSTIRRDLRDEDANNYRWTDGEIDRHITRAVKEFSEALPREQKTTLATTAGSRELSIATLQDRVVVTAVEYPADKFPRQYRRFSLWEDTLSLLIDEIPDGSDCHVYYGKLHSLDASGSTIPTQYEDMIAAGAAGYATVAWGIFAVNRVNTGGETTPEALLEWGKDRLNLFRTELKRLSRRNRIRIQTLYQPYQPVRSGTTDYGP
jgi:hypothetical protein